MDNIVRDIVWVVDPIGKPRMTRRDKWLQPPRKPVRQYFEFKNGVQLYALRDNYTVTVPLSLTFVIPMPASWSKKKREQMNGQPHESTPDLDNMIKAFKDALCDRDEHVHTYGSMKKIWGEQGQIIIHYGKEI